MQRQNQAEKQTQDGQSHQPLLVTLVVIIIAVIFVILGVSVSAFCIRFNKANSSSRTSGLNNDNRNHHGTSTSFEIFDLPLPPLNQTSSDMILQPELFYGAT